MKSITVDQELELSIEPQDSRGNPARVDGDPVWTVGDESVLQLLPGATPFRKIVRGVGPIDASVVTVTVDADLGEGVKPLSGTLAIAVVPGEASSLAITAGEATAIPAPPAADPVPAEPAPADPAPAATETPAAPAPEAVEEQPAAVSEAVVEAPVGEQPAAEPQPAEPVPSPGEPAVEAVAEPAPAETAGDPVASAPVEEVVAPVAEAPTETPAEGGETPAG